MTETALDAFPWDADAEAFKIGKSAGDLKTMAEWQEPGTPNSASGSRQPPEKATPVTRSRQ